MDGVRPILKRDGTPYREITEREPNWAWSRRMWGWGVEQTVTHGIYLQDDLYISDDFWLVVDAMVRAVPNRVISLISNHPLSERSLASGHAWFLMCDCLGSGYIFPTMLMKAFLDWRDGLGEVARTYNEDFLITCWQFLTGRRSWCPVPTVIQTHHDDEVQTTNAREARYLFRQAYITWKLASAAGLPITTRDYWLPTTYSPIDFGFHVQHRQAAGIDSRTGLPMQFEPTEEVLEAHCRLLPHVRSDHIATNSK